MSLMGKAALVTGASRGIGKAVALALAEAGADVAVNYVGREQSAEETAAAIRALGRRAFTVRADVSDADQVESMIRRVVEEFGRLDVLVNNAGITRDNLLIRMKEDEFEQVLDTNLKGVFHCTKAAARVMLRQRGGRIINISSVVGVIGNAGQANYAAAKAGVIGLTKACARELAGKGITVNCVAPGFIETEMTDKLSDEQKTRLLAQIPLGRFGSVEDVARVVRFLASDEASYMTGQTICVDGGMCM
ncbi:MAG: beta-ketoacyl-ACP reductase [Candidatus Reconcilbacillus cellulovorans]|uniref:3-oxoacyl-[acyl-carrier-protein] reductase n=1 Tax=Candidatus Reconcilbacillus cellulovorans TaxID=1906605 RepID=A0A2A6E2I3_9BACL|nr:MAG: beta-ketoacyl-ACP reductase [Candidatus Reconcilbacillus cellulovorans]